MDATTSEAIEQLVMTTDQMDETRDTGKRPKRPRHNTKKKSIVGQGKGRPNKSTAPPPELDEEDEEDDQGDAVEDGSFNPKRKGNGSRVVTRRDDLGIDLSVQEAQLRDEFEALDQRRLELNKELQDIRQRRKQLSSPLVDLIRAKSEPDDNGRLQSIVLPDGRLRVAKERTVQRLDRAYLIRSLGSFIMWNQGVESPEEARSLAITYANYAIKNLRVEERYVLRRVYTDLNKVRAPRAKQQRKVKLTDEECMVAETMTLSLDGEPMDALPGKSSRGPKMTKDQKDQSIMFDLPPPGNLIVRNSSSSGDPSPSTSHRSPPVSGAHVKAKVEVPTPQAPQTTRAPQTSTGTTAPVVKPKALGKDKSKSKQQQQPRSKPRLNDVSSKMTNAPMTDVPMTTATTLTTTPKFLSESLLPVTVLPTFTGQSY